MGIKTILALAVVAFIAINAVRFQNRGKKLDTATAALKDSTSQLRVVRQSNGTLTKKVEGLRKDSLTLALKVTTLEKRALAGDAAAANQIHKVQVAVATTNAAIASWTEEKQKLEALKLAFKEGKINEARLRDSLSNMPVFTDAEANKIYLQTVAERDAWKKSSEEATRKWGEARQQISDLEFDLNKTDKDRAAAVTSSIYAEDSWVKEAQTKRFGDLRGKARRENALRKAAEVRAKREGTLTN